MISEWVRFDQITLLTVFDLITAQTPISAQSRSFLSLHYSQCTFGLLLHKDICCGYSFELHRLVNAIQMSIHNMSL